MPLVDATPITRGARPSAPDASSSSVIRNGASTFTASTGSHLSGVMLASSLSRVIPALCTTTSSRPYREVTCASRREAASSAVTSSCSAVPWISLATVARASPAVDEGGAPGEQEPQPTEHGRRVQPDAVGHQQPVAGRSAAQLLGQGPQDALDAAAGRGIEGILRSLAKE